MDFDCSLSSLVPLVLIAEADRPCAGLRPLPSCCLLQDTFLGAKRIGFARTMEWSLRIQSWALPSFPFGAGVRFSKLKDCLLFMFPTCLCCQEWVTLSLLLNYLHTCVFKGLFERSFGMTTGHKLWGEYRAADVSETLSPNWNTLETQSVLCHCSTV